MKPAIIDLCLLFFAAPYFTFGQENKLPQIDNASKIGLAKTEAVGNSPEMILLKLTPESSELDIHNSLIALGEIGRYYKNDIDACKRAFESIKSINAMRLHVWKDKKLIGPANFGAGVAAQQKLEGADSMGNPVYVDIILGLSLLKKTIAALPELERAQSKELLQKINVFLIDLASDDEIKLGFVNSYTGAAWLGAAETIIQEGKTITRLKERMVLVEQLLSRKSSK